MIFCVSSTSEAYWRPYHNNIVVNGASIGWGYYGWPIVVGPVYTFPVYGYSYWGYWNYEPYYATYGAIAYSKATGQFGFAYAHNSRRAAERDAVNYCGEEDCKSVIWVQGGCGALAKSPAIPAVPASEGVEAVEAVDARMGYAYASNKLDAQRYAMRGCKRSGGEACKQLAWVCSY